MYLYIKIGNYIILKTHELLCKLALTYYFNQ